MSGIPAGAGQLLGKRLGKFEILALLALGGTAEIYLARIGGAAGFEKYVVVKCLHDHLADDAEFVKMFLDEARLAAHLDHSNIVQTMELGQHDGRYYMVMEFLAGLSLAMIVRRVGERMPTMRIPPPLVLNILAQACAGLHYAHEKALNGKPLGIVHRDISPQNLVISFEGVVKVVDFGIAKAEMRETRTRSGTIKGKFAYMSPEQCVANNVDRRTDVFALGVIGHELLTGRRLFKRPSPYETYQAVMECDVKPPSTYDASVDPSLDPVLMRALTKDKDTRYPTAEAFGDALLGYLHHRGIGSGPGDVSRFFDAQFRQELDEHSARMRELISGRDISVDTGVSWGDDELDEDARRETAARMASQSSGALTAAGDFEPPRRPSPSSLSNLIDELGTGSRVEDDDEMPAERTRIESNPLERVNELERMMANAPGPAADRAPSLPGPPSSAAAPGMPRSGRFPDLANLPTVISPSDSAMPAADAFGNIPTTVAPMVPPSVEGFANAPTSLAPNVPPPVDGFAHAPTGRAPDVPPAVGGFGHAPTSPAPAPGGFARPAPPTSPPRIATAFPNAPTTIAQPIVPPGPPGPQGYPVMNAQLSEQIATGATVFPSAQPGAHPGRPAPDSHPPYAPGGPNGRQRSGSSAPPRSASAPGAQEPMAPMAIGSVPGGDHGLLPYAAELMSPVGQQHPEQVDWAQAAAVPARAVPPWLLAILFLAAIGIATALTLVIARIIR